MLPSVTVFKRARAPAKLRARSSGNQWNSMNSLVAEGFYAYATAARISSDSKLIHPFLTALWREKKSFLDMADLEWSSSVQLEEDIADKRTEAALGIAEVKTAPVPEEEPVEKAPCPRRANSRNRVSGKQKHLRAVRKAALIC